MLGCALLGCLMALAVAPARAHIAACTGFVDAEARSLERLMHRDPRAAVRAAEARIAALSGAAQATDPARRDRLRAEFYAVIAAADSILELDTQAREAVQQGLRFVPDEHDPTHVGLVLARAVNVYDSPGIERELAIVQRLSGQLPPSSRVQICLQLALGMLQLRNDRSDLAVQSLTDVYRRTSAPGLEAEHADAAEELSSLMRRVGEYQQALALNQEEIDFHDAQGAVLDLSVARFLRGEIRKAAGDPAGALSEYAEARRLSLQIEDLQGVAFEDLRTCEAQVELMHLRSARQQCENAQRTFLANHTTDMVMETETALASIDFAEGRPERALATLDKVLANGGIEMPAWRVPNVYRLRARANARVGNFRQALADYESYMHRYVTDNDAVRGQQALALRARFETDRAMERNAALQRELELAHESAQRQRAALRLTVIAGAAGALVIALLSYILVNNLRHRRQLLRMANDDPLTGLPNRGATAARAASALAAALQDQQPLTLALLDMDHFKAVNDRHGHAAGDYVLREFAQRSRSCLRASDIFGRWGGEEFLLLLPDTTLDTALVIVERLRTVALDVRRPGSDAAIGVSISAGLATTAEGVRSLDELIARADEALYDAKNGGRDLVRVADASYRSASTGVRRALQQGPASSAAG